VIVGYSNDGSSIFIALDIVDMVKLLEEPVATMYPEGAIPDGHPRNVVVLFETTPADALETMRVATELGGGSIEIRPIGGRKRGPLDDI
jgi:hypothetical protein